MSIYQRFFGLAKDPFDMTPDPEFLYVTEQHREALAGLAYAIVERKGFTVLTGPAGTGKTTLVRKVLRSLLSKGVQSSVIFNPTLTASEFLEAALLDFGMPDVPASKAQRIWRFQQNLLNWNAEGKAAALIVDEAHLLTPELLEEIRLLSNFEFSHQKLLQIVLVGQSELSDLLNQDRLKQLKQRIAIRLTLSPLSPAEVGEYVKHRWSKAGGAASPFTTEAIGVLAEASGGTPRIINAICYNALLLAFAQAENAVTGVHIRSACQDLQIRLVASKPTLEQPMPMPEEAVPVAVPANGRVTPLRAPLRTLEVYEPKPSWWARWTKGRLAN
jgi:general secretion pathway protein A